MKYSEVAKKLWPKAELIHGDGEFALLAHCQVLTITLHETRDDAVRVKSDIDSNSCGGSGCVKNHEIRQMFPVEKHIGKKIIKEWRSA